MFERYSGVQFTDHHFATLYCKPNGVAAHRIAVLAVWDQNFGPRFCDTQQLVAGSLTARYATVADVGPSS